MKKTILAVAICSAFSTQAFSALDTAGIWIEGQKQDSTDINSLTASKSEFVNDWSTKTAAGVLVNQVNATITGNVIVDISNQSTKKTAGIAVQNGAIANFKNGDTNISVNSKGGDGQWGFGLIVEGEGSTVNFDETVNNVKISTTQNDYSSQTLTIAQGSIGTFNNKGDVVIKSYSPYGVTAISAYGTTTFNNTGNVLLTAEIQPGDKTGQTNVVGIQGSNSSLTVTNKVKEFKIALNGAGVDNDGTSYSTGTKAISASNMTVDIQAQNFVIDMKIAADIEDASPEGHTANQAYGIDADGTSKVTIANSTQTKIKIDQGLGTAYGINAKSGASVNFQGNLDVAVTGKIEAIAVKATGEKSTVTLAGQKNSLVGNVQVTEKGKVNLNTGATTVKGDVTVDADSFLTMKDSSLELKEGSTAKVDGTLTSTNGQLFVNEAKENLVTIANLADDSTFTMGATGSLNDKLGGDIEAFNKTFTITNGAEQADILMKEGLVAGEKTAQLNKDGTIDKSTITEKTNSVMDSTLQMASYMPMAMTRILTNDVRKRMGDLRASEGKSGAWARYDGGKFSGERGFDTDFHTIQVGVDTIPTPDSARFGIAFSYTDGESEYVRTNSDMNAFSLAGYATWMAENGLFVDGVLRMAKVDNDVTVDGNLKGTMDNVVLSASAETGWRFDLNEMFYVEPQAEVMYTYVDGDKFDIGAAQYEIDAADSFTGRLGFASGIKCPNNKGDLYVRASVVHEFLGDSRVTGFAQGSSGVLELDGKDTWVEYGFGGNFNLTKNTYLWADVERTSGSTLDTDYRATIGVRHAF